MGVVLVGAGGHAKSVVEAIEATDLAVEAYVDPNLCAWLKGIARYSSDDCCEEVEAEAFVLGMGAASVDGLVRRLDIYRRYRKRGWAAPAVVHPSAVVSARALLGDGCQVLAGAAVLPGAVVGEAAIVNTRAVVEHDSGIGDGAHVAPGAIVLGGVRVGNCVMIGAGAVVLSGARVPDGALVPALGRYPN